LEEENIGIRNSKHVLKRFELLSFYKNQLSCVEIKFL